MEKRSINKIKKWIESPATVDEIFEYIEKKPDNLEYVLPFVSPNILVKLMPKLNAEHLMIVINSSDICSFAGWTHPLKELLLLSILRMPPSNLEEKSYLLATYCQALINTF